MKILQSPYYQPRKLLSASSEPPYSVQLIEDSLQYASKYNPFESLLDDIFPGVHVGNHDMVIRKEQLKDFERCTDFTTVAYSHKNNTLYEDSWDFKNANTKEYTHCFHSYPAKMIPQVARRIIEIYGENATLLFDPYCGTRTSLVEANLKGINAIGTDLNPLARLIAQAKTTKIDSKVLDKYLYDFTNYLFSKSFKEEDYSTITLPCITNIDI